MCWNLNAGIVVDMNSARYVLKVMSTSLSYVLAAVLVVCRRPFVCQVACEFVVASSGRWIVLVRIARKKRDLYVVFLRALDVLVCDCPEEGELKVK